MLLTLLSPQGVTSGISGTLSTTLDAATLAASGTVTAGATGTLSRTLDAATLASSGTLTAGATGTLAGTLDAATLASSGTLTAGNAGTLSQTLDSATLSSSGTLLPGLSGQLTRTLDNATLVSSGTLQSISAARILTLAPFAFRSGGTYYEGIVMRPTQLRKNSVLYWSIFTYNSSGILTDADSLPTITIRRNGVATSDVVTVTKRAATTGIYDCVCNPTGEVDGDIFEFAESAVVLGTTYINAFNVVVPPSLAFVFDPVFSVVRGRVADSTMNFYRGETINATITVTDASGLAVDLSTKTLRLVFENATTGTDIASVTSFTLGGAGNNNATFAVPSAVTNTVTGTTPHVWSLRDTADGNRVLALGSVVVRSAATADA